MMRRHCMPHAAGLILLLLLFGNAAGHDACPLDRPAAQSVPIYEPALESGDKGTYNGTIRVYVTEIEGRWSDRDNKAFRNAFLAFALQQSFSLNETQTLTWDLTWDGNNYQDAYGQPFGDIEEDNIRVIAAVFKSTGYTGYSVPPSGRPFTVYEIDAVAAAECGTTGYNISNTGFTHTVLVEDGATVW